MPKLFFVFILAVAAMAASIFAADFRNASWGMTPDQVKEVEEAELTKELPERLIFATEIAGLEMNISYIFKDEKLSSARYELTGKYRNAKDYNIAYNDMQKQLQKKYGDPITENLQCKDNFYTDYPHRWGTGIVVGKLRRTSSWQSEDVYVRHTIGAYPGGSVAHWIEYLPMMESKLDKYYDTQLSSLL